MVVPGWMPLSQECLARAGRAGLAVLYRRHAKALRHRAWRLLGCRHEAEDVLQEVFLAMVSQPGLHRGEASVFTLLYQMVTHKALDRCRARSRRHERLMGVWGALPQGVPRGGRGSAESLDAAGDLQWMSRAEPPRTLMAALLHFAAGHTQGEVAALLGVSRKTVVRMLGRLQTQVAGGGDA
ncbi:RNA polymerase, sigma-24 subunit, ECF subfamily protein [Corallococcus macrosporus]|uniref:RNA polymerase, sigma-24 subunit, ECF subfamily protein n=1 Tax=Myxococcus fulvus (strain ATCC BAA-855 / HW-1) TaxID=483219 RepID=F8CMD1_MYXFH|nr:RNA polymerase, sigma-24 subunit, ECF subfamily protein [Corallococcus macrosporus]